MVTKGGTQILPKITKIVATYWHDHSLESSWGALGTISFGEMHYLNFITKNPFLEEFNAKTYLKCQLVHIGPIFDNVSEFIASRSQYKAHNWWKMDSLQNNNGKFYQENKKFTITGKIVLHKSYTI
jgi:hypothetical protein